MVAVRTTITTTPLPTEEAQTTIDSLVDNAKMMAVGLGSAGAVVGVIIVLLFVCRYCRHRSTAEGRHKTIVKSLTREAKKKTEKEKQESKKLKLESKKAAETEKNCAERETELLDELKKRRKKLAEKASLHHGKSGDKKHLWGGDADNKEKRDEEEDEDDVLEDTVTKKLESELTKVRAEMSAAKQTAHELKLKIKGLRESDVGVGVGGVAKEPIGGASSSSVIPVDEASLGAPFLLSSEEEEVEEEEMERIASEKAAERARTKKPSRRANTYSSPPLTSSSVLDDDELLTIPYPTNDGGDEDEEDLYVSRLERERHKNLVSPQPLDLKKKAKLRPPTFVPNLPIMIQREDSRDMWSRRHEEGATLEDERWLSFQREEFERLSRIPVVPPLAPLRRFEGVDVRTLDCWSPSSPTASCRLVNETPFSL